VFFSDYSVSWAEGGYVDNVLLRKNSGLAAAPGREAAPALPSGVREEPISLSLAREQPPALCTVYMNNQTGGQACVEVQGSDAGWKCHSPGYASYGSFPAGTYTYCMQACEGYGCWSYGFEPGRWDMTIQCVPGEGFDRTFSRSKD
jgi:hypothetical protein